MWELKSQTENKRLYVNKDIGNVCPMSMVYVDKDGNKWWGFDDMFSLPYTRDFAAKKVTALYALGLSKDDLFGFINSLKSLSKSQDKEKYEKIYAATLDFETKANNAIDPVKQMSALVPVYYTLNDEPIDSFGNDIQIKKMSLLEADIDLHSFFLKRQIGFIEDYTKSLKILSQIVLPKSIEPLEVSEVKSHASLKLKET